MGTPSADTHRPDIGPLDDAALVARARSGDFDAFEALVSRHEQQVYGLAMSMLGHREDAQDVVQTVFLKALENLKGFEERASFRTWISRIAVNTALKWIRKRRGLTTIPLQQPVADGETGEIEHPDFVADWRDNPHEALSDAELHALLDHAIQDLPDPQRLVFVLRDVEGFSTRETAEKLGIGEANVKVRLLRARLALRERLTRVLGDPEKRIRHSHRHDGHERDATPVDDLLHQYQRRGGGTPR